MQLTDKEALVLSKMTKQRRTKQRKPRNKYLTIYYYYKKTKFYNPLPIDTILHTAGRGDGRKGLTDITNL